MSKKTSPFSLSIYLNCFVSLLFFCKHAINDAYQVLQGIRDRQTVSIPDGRCYNIYIQRAYSPLQLCYSIFFILFLFFFPLLFLTRLASVRIRQETTKASFEFTSAERQTEVVSFTPTGRCHLWVIHCGDWSLLWSVWLRRCHYTAVQRRRIMSSTKCSSVYIHQKRTQSAPPLPPWSTTSRWDYVFYLHLIP